MSRRSPKLTIEEVSGDQYSDLPEAQRAALKATAADLVTILQSLLATGKLIRKGGRISFNSDQKE